MSIPQLSIGEFCATGSGGTPDRGNDQYYGGSIPWVKSGELRESVILDTEEKITELALRESSAKIVPSGTILLAMYGATVGRMAVLGVDAATNQAVCNIRPDPNRADTRYVFHGLQAKLDYFLSRAAGGAQPNISQGIVRDTKLPLPPLGEQRRIAAILDKADALRLKRRCALELLDGLTQSIFLEMFGNPRLDEVRWQSVPFEEACSDVTAKSGKLQRAEYLQQGTVPIIDQGQKFVAGWSDDQELVTRVEDAVIVFGDHTRAVKYVDFDFIVGADGAKVLRPSGRYIPRFFSALMENMPIPDLGYSRHMREVKKLFFPVPPLVLQQEFAARMKRLDEVRSQYFVASAARLDSLFLSLQQRAFSGGLP